MLVDFLRKLEFLFQPATLKVAYGGRGGIYAIYNKTNGKYYLSSAGDFYKRRMVHFSQLNNNIHYNKHIQRAWNKYWGEYNFEFIILEYCEISKEILETREQWWLDVTQCWKRSIGYNLSPTANSQLGIKRSEETKKRMSLAVTGRKVVFTESHKANLSLAAKGKKKSETHRQIIAKNNRARVKEPSKWPHPKGNRCKCEECLTKKSNYLANWRANKSNQTWQ